jgi:beta-N-acetylhexosaminidase
MRRRISALLLGVPLVAGIVASPLPPAVAWVWAAQPGAASPQLAAGGPTLRQMIGQKLMVAMRGTRPGPGLLDRIRRGEVGGVILFSANIRSPAQLARLTRTLRRAARTGGRPPLLIATDQEGGLVKRVGWAPPSLSPPRMGALGSPAAARSQGKGTGRMLSCAGINHDLAPVADVPRSTASFMFQQGRTWSFDASVTTMLSNAFAGGLLANGVLPTLKHFPGIGLAARNTDTNVVTISASRRALAPGLRAYRRGIADRLPLVMLSNAAYSAYDPSGAAAGWSRAISLGLLRGNLGFRGISITDSLSGTAGARGIAASVLAVRAARAGTDMILLTGSARESNATFSRLLSAARDGRIPLSRLRASHHRILATKARITPPPADATNPTVNAPVSALVAGGRLGAGTAPVRTTWSATDGCRIALYSLRRQRGGGRWAGQTLPSGLATSVVQPLPVAATFRYGARATDGAGNTSGWAAGKPFVVRRAQESDGGVVYQKRWFTASSGAASGGRVAYSNVAGARVTFSFTGSSVAWVARRGPHLGAAAVSIDGRQPRRINLHAPIRRHRAIVFARRWASQGQHTLTIVNLATDGHPRIDVDAFLRLVRKV